ncbi:MAG: hypothetical protein PF503_06285 [Desulfobacula sp.]|jgi:hypothetical protein|nr:hypothetical protein [Desulfobacula sp.]
MYTPPIELFRPEELFSPLVIQDHIDKGRMSSIWRLMDPRLLWTAVQLRGLFGPLTINDWLWDGDNKNRGYRSPLELFDRDYFIRTGSIRASWSSFTSQHCLGNALDGTFKNILADEVRAYIIHNSQRREFKYITAIEKEVPWLHVDTRNFKAGNDRFFIF